MREASEQGLRQTGTRNLHETRKAFGPTRRQCSRAANIQRKRLLLGSLTTYSPIAVENKLRLRMMTWTTTELDNTTPLGVDQGQLSSKFDALKGLRDEGKFTVR